MKAKSVIDKLGSTAERFLRSKAPKNLDGLRDFLVTQARVSRANGVKVEDVRKLNGWALATLIASRLQEGNKTGVKFMKVNFSLARGETTTIDLADTEGNKLVVDKRHLDLLCQDLKGVEVKLSDKKDSLLITTTTEEVDPKDMTKKFCVFASREVDGKQEFQPIILEVDSVKKVRSGPPREIIVGKDRTKIVIPELKVGEELTVKLDKLNGGPYKLAKSDVEEINKKNENIQASLSDDGKSLIIKGIQATEDKQNVAFKGKDDKGNKKELHFEIAKLISNTLRNVLISGGVAIAGLLSSFGLFKFGGDNLLSKFFGAIGGIVTLGAIPLFLWLDGYIGKGLKSTLPLEKNNANAGKKSEGKPKNKSENK